MFDFDGCLRRFREDPALESYRLRIEKRLLQVTEARNQLHSVFLSSRAIEWVRATAGDSDPIEIRNTLLILTYHPDSSIKQRACKLLAEGAAAVPASCQ